MEIKILTNGYVKTIEDKINCRYYDINSSRENRINAITSIAAISRGKDKSSNPEKRYKHLLKEAAPNISFYDLIDLESKQQKIEKVAGRPLEYCPVVLTGYVKGDIDFDNSILGIDIELGLKDKYITFDYVDFMNEIGRFSYIEYVETTSINRPLIIYTNARALINAGIKEENIPFNRPLETINYFICEVKAPYFVFAQLRTHGLLSQVAVSERVTEEDEYWLPEDILERLKNNDICIKLFEQYSTCSLDKLTVEDLVETMLISMPPITARNFLKELGYKQEIYNRWPNHMKYKTWIIGGWLHNPYQWGHFLLEREAFEKILKSWVQPETKETAKAIRTLINHYVKNGNTAELNYHMVNIDGKILPVFNGLKINNEKDKDGK
jgi:hypothetical protein